VEFFKAKFFKTIIRSKTELYRAAKQIEAVAQIIVPYTQFLTPAGEGIKFHTIKFTRLLIKACGLEEAAKH
jgi:hypothetical protein